MTSTQTAPGTTATGAASRPTLLRRALRSTSRVRIGTAMVAALAIGAVGLIAEPAYADSYPSWQDVQNAKSSEAAAAAEVDRINALIAQLQSEVNQTHTNAVLRGEEFATAQAKFDNADIRARQLQQQADASKAKADAATAQAGRLAAQLYRARGTDFSANIFLSAGSGARSLDPHQLLSNLGSMSKLVENSRDVYKSAVTATNSAQALTKQADVAKTEREKLRVAADAALQVASAAAQTAQDKLAEQQQNIVVMQAQLAALQDATATTVAGYERGVAARTLEATAAAGGGLAGGYVGPQGWAVPAAGRITDGFGPRPSPCAGCSSWHLGIDIGAGYDAPIYAAHAGTVVYAGWYGGYGNFVLLDNGDGIQTGYGHIREGGTLVHTGQHVTAGEPIARVGSTGASSGNHLHFEVRVNGSAVDGIPFMNRRGAPLG